MLYNHIGKRRSFSLHLTLISKVAWVVKSAYVRDDMRAAPTCGMVRKIKRISKPLPLKQFFLYLKAHYKLHLLQTSFMKQLI